MAEPALEASDHKHGKVDQRSRYAAAADEFTSQYEQRHRKKGEDVELAEHPLRQDGQITSGIDGEEAQHGGRASDIGDRRAAGQRRKCKRYD